MLKNYRITELQFYCVFYSSFLKFSNMKNSNEQQQCAKNAEREIRDLFTAREKAHYHVQAMLQICQANKKLNLQNQNAAYYHYLCFIIENNK